MICTSEVVWRFEGVEPEGIPYLYLTKSAEATRLSTVETVRFLIRGRWRGSAPAKLRNDSATRDREIGNITESVGERGWGDDGKKERLVQYTTHGGVKHCGKS